MTAEAPLIELRDVTKVCGGLRPLRVRALRVSAADRVALFGFDQTATEAFVNLVTGASLPDQGEVHIAGRSTQDIATGVDWLASLDRFGLVTSRAVLLDHLTTAANMALPLTLAIDPIPDLVRETIDGLARAVGLSQERLDAPASALTAAERVRLHLARAVAPGPHLVLLEHPTAALDSPSEIAALGTTLRELSEARRFGWIVLTADEAFARACGAAEFELTPASGEIRRRAAASRWQLPSWLGQG